jgi:hypothetical protein
VLSLRYLRREVASAPDGSVVEPFTEIDDIIPRLYQDKIEAEVGSERMPWFFNPESARRVQVESSYGGFSHVPFRFNEPNVPPSPLTALLLPLLFTFCDKAGVSFKSLLRIRIGLFTRNSGGGPYHNPHVDFYLPHHNALYYVNDSDGDTFVFNETYDDVSQERSIEYTRDRKFTVARQISPKKGRMIGFPGKHYHASMHPMQSSHRIAIAFSFI